MADPAESEPLIPPPPRAASVSRTNRNLWLAFTEEAKANRMYVAYAFKAMEEGYPEVAEVFLEVSGAETAHALQHLHVLGEVDSTFENLKRVIEEEMREASVMYPRMIRQAETEGRADAAGAFRLAFEGESRHAQLFSRAMERMRTRGTTTRPRTAPQLAEPAALVQATPAAAPRQDESVSYEQVRSEADRVAGLRRVRELVFGAQDGLISTVTVAATIMAATQDNGTAIIAGIGSAMAGTISMAAGTYLGSRATSQMEQGELEMEQREIARRPDEEHAELVATYRHDGYSYEEAEALADRLMLDRDLTLQVMAERELGISPEVTKDARKDAAVMGVSYILGSIVPLTAFIFFHNASAVLVSVLLTLIALAGVGVAKARISYRPVLPSVLEVTGIGAASGTLGYLLGDWLPRLFGAL